MKYIEENKLEGAELKELHRSFIKTLLKAIFD